MSGIYGFMIKHQESGESYLHALDVWNRAYGHDGSDTLLFDKSGAGCHLEHLSESFPPSVPVIIQDNIIAVIDAILYNRDEILKSLNMNVNSTSPDEELLIQLIQTNGYSSLSQVNGDFAGAIYDKSSKTWTLFRDHLGIRPLFYYEDNNIFAFSTDMRGLASIPCTDLSINEEKLYLRMMGYNDLSLCETEYAKINCISPASWNIIAEKKHGFSFEKHIYWKLGQKKIRMQSDEEYQSELRNLIADAVKRRMDVVPGIIGGELSGGLDSSIIAILISRLGREGTFFSWSYDPEDIPLREDEDERKIILDICKQENFNCEFTRMKPPVTIDQLFKKIDPPYINTRYIGDGAKCLKNHNTRVVFTGHGGDEGVSHRCNLYELWYHHEYWNFLKAIYRTSDRQNLRFLRTIKRAVHQLLVVNPYFRRPFQKTHANASRFLNSEFVARMHKIVKPQPLYFAYDPVAYIMQGGSRVRLDNVAVQGAESGMRYMIPYLDYRVIDFAVSIPRYQFKNGITNRYIFRQAYNDIIPQSLREMHYKDMPSTRDYWPDLDLRAHFLESKKQFLKHFNKEYWKDYLNIEEIENLTLEENYTHDDYHKVSSEFNELMLCCAIQNMAERAAKWSNEHE